MPNLAPQYLDSMYNNRALVPDHARHFSQRAQASEHAREAVACMTDIAYGPSAMEKLDVFPSSQVGAPVLVFIHGGYWRSFDKSQHSFIASAFVNQGTRVVAPNYLLSPAVKIFSVH